MSTLFCGWGIFSCVSGAALLLVYFIASYTTMFEIDNKDALSTAGFVLLFFGLFCSAIAISYCWLNPSRRRNFTARLDIDEERAAGFPTNGTYDNSTFEGDLPAYDDLSIATNSELPSYHDIVRKQHKLETQFANQNNSSDCGTDNEPDPPPYTNNI